MSQITLRNIEIFDNPAGFSNPFQFEITFECHAQLEESLEWSVIYVGCAEDCRYDQVLEEVLVGPVAEGLNKFVLQADAPNPSLIPARDLVGTTAVLISCSYKSHEFIRVGYYCQINHCDPIISAAYDEVGRTGVMPPFLSNMSIDIAQLTRSIEYDNPRVTHFAIDWRDASAIAMDADNSLLLPDTTAVREEDIMSDERPDLAFVNNETASSMDSDSDGQMQTSPIHNNNEHRYVHSGAVC